MQEYTTELTEFHDRFLEIEAELGLFDIIIDQVPVWERLREGLKIDILAKTGLTGTVHPDTSTLKDSLQASYLLCRNVVQRNPFISPSAELVFFGHPRRKERAGQWWDIYCDPLHSEVGYEAVHLEPPWNKTHYTPTPTPRLRYTDLVEFSGQLNAQLNIRPPSVPPETKKRIETAEDRFEDTFDVSVSLTERLFTMLRSRIVKKPLYDRLLTRIDPQLVVILAHSSRETFIEACHDADIPVAELQHGQISPYSYQHAFPGNRTKQAYPDYLLTFGECWETAASLPLQTDRVIPVGYPYLEQELQQRLPLERKQQIVFISTPEAGPILSEIAAELSSRPEIPYDIVYKLHPDEFERWPTDYPWLRDAPLSVVGRDGPSLYDLFAESSVQIGVGSTALYEGLAFELTTYLLREPTVEWLGPAIEHGDATVIESASELAGRLGDADRRPVQRERYFKPDAVSNAVGVLEELVETGTVRPDVTDRE